MEHTIRKINHRKVEPNVIGISLELWQLLQQSTKGDWESLFIEFRLNLQNRIIGLKGDDLIKLQGKLELINEIESFFIKVIHSSPLSQVNF